MGGWVLIAVVFAAFAFLIALLRTFDLGGPIRNAILAVTARLLQNRRPRPDVVERTYRTGGEYQRDAARLALLGYEVSSETVSSPVVETASYLARPAWTIRVPMAHVTYELRKST